MDFYLILQEIMEEKGINIPSVARMCGLSDGTVRSMIARKQKNVALEVAFKLSDGLGVSLERLNGTPEKNTHENKKTPLCSSEAMEVAEAYDGADPVIQFGVRKLLDLDVPEIRMVARGSRVKCLSGKPDAKEIDEAIRETPSET